MRSFKRYMLTVSCCLLLAGCATAEEEDVGVYNEPDIAMTYQDMAREMSGGSVQIYNLDMPAPPVTSMSSPTTAPVVLEAPVPDDGGVAYSADPNVTVYPFSDDPVYPDATRPALVPPSGDFRPLPSPFGSVPMPMAEPPATMTYPEDHSDAARVYYRHGSSTLNAAGNQVVDHVARSGGNLIVSGHASERTQASDPVESSIINLKMSMDRAFKVSSQLIREGVPAAAIETRAYGATQPAYAPGVDAEAASRRVEIYTDGMLTPMTAPVEEGEAPIPDLVRY